MQRACAAPVKVDRQWDFAYDADGTRVRQVVSTFDPDTQAITGVSVTSYFAGGLYEEADGAVRKYYAISGMTVAMSDAEGVTCDSCRRYLRWPLEAASQRKYLPTDHLGSVNAVRDDAGTLLEQQRYLPFGGLRTNVGTITQTDFGYTGQRDLAGMGLMDYRARAYDPLLGRFIQPDTVIPNFADPQAWNRYSYVLNRPVLFDDPTGHCAVACPFLVAAAVVAMAYTVAYVADPHVRESSHCLGESLASGFERWQRGIWRHERDIQRMEAEATQTADNGKFPKGGGRCTSSVQNAVICATAPLFIGGLVVFAALTGGCGEPESLSLCSPKSTPTPGPASAPTATQTASSTSTPEPTIGPARKPNKQPALDSALWKTILERKGLQ